MNVKQIEDKFGLPARVRIPLPLRVFTNTFGNKVATQEYLHRTITKRLENGHYLQYNDKEPNKGEFQCCYWNGTLHNDWEYNGKPTEEQLPVKLGENNGRN